MRIAFMGTPDFAVPTLDALVAAGFQIAAVYSQPPRPAGRGRKLTPGAVHRRAEELGLPVRTPTSLKDPDAQTDFAALALDAAVVVAYGLILRPPVLSAPRLGCVNLHGSLLPRWRGAAPVQRAIMAGDAETGVCAMAMDEGLDTGPVLLSERVAIDPDEDAGALSARLAALGAPLIVRALRGLAEGGLTPQPQPSDRACYARKIDKAETRLDWSQPAETLRNRIRGLAPAPGAWTEATGERWKILSADVVARGGSAGETLDDALTVACGDGRALRILRAQRPGKGPMDAAEILRGRPVAPGTRLNADQGSA
jgi:methionyl-tRNA formyltransferase